MQGGQWLTCALSHVGFMAGLWPKAAIFKSCRGLGYQGLDLEGGSLDDSGGEDQMDEDVCPWGSPTSQQLPGPVPPS